MTDCKGLFGKWFSKDRKHSDEIMRLINYYSNRLMLDQNEYQKNTQEVFKKMYAYRNKLIEYGIELPDE